MSKLTRKEKIAQQKERAPFSEKEIKKQEEKNDTKIGGKEMIQKLKNINDTKIPTTLVLVIRTRMQKETKYRRQKLPGTWILNINALCY